MKLFNRNPYQRAQFFPKAGLVERCQVADHRTTAAFHSPVAVIDFLGHRLRLEHLKQIFDAVKQLMPVFFHHQNVVSLLAYDLLGDDFPAAHSINGHYCSAQLQRGQ